MGFDPQTDCAIPDPDPNPDPEPDPVPMPMQNLQEIIEFEIQIHEDLDINKHFASAMHKTMREMLVILFAVLPYKSPLILFILCLCVLFVLDIYDDFNF